MTTKARTSTRALHKTTKPGLKAVTGLRAALYMRQSLDAAGDEMAVTRQEKANRDYCAAKEWTVVKVYRENDTSASGRRPRPLFNQMLADAAAGDFDVIVSMFLDRLTRSVRDLLPLIDLYRRHGVATATVRDGIDLTTDVGELMATILAAVANMEIRRKGVRQMLANEQRALDGQPRSGGGEALGFRHVTEMVDGRKVRRRLIDEPAAVLVRQAYKDLLAGRSLAGIARDLAATKYRTAKKNTFTDRSVRDLLRNPRNAGLSVYQGEIVGQADWPPIVDESIWRAAKAILDDPARRTDPRGGNTRKHLGVAIYQCGVCDDGTTVETKVGSSRGNRALRKYKCRESLHVIRAAPQIDAFVIDAIIERVSRDDAAEILIDRDRPDLGALQAQATDLRTRLDDLAEAFAEGEITRAQLRVATAKLRGQLDQVEGEMTHTSRAAVLADLVAAKDKRAAWESFDLDRQRAIINVLCRVTILKARSGGNSRLSGADRPIRPGSVEVDFHV